MAFYKNKYFYVAFILGLVFFNYIFGGNIYDYFSSFFVKKNIEIANKNYIRKTDFYDIFSKSALINISIGNGDYINYSNTTNSIKLLKVAENLINSDIVALLDGTNNKLVVFESHVKQIMSTTNKIDNVLIDINAKLNEYRQQAIHCQDQKQKFDSQFFQGLASNDETMIAQGLNGSLENGPCYMKNRIYSNFYAIISEKLGFYNDILKRKYDILTQNQDMIMQNYKLFKDNVLDDLLELRNQIQQFKTNQD